MEPATNSWKENKSNSCCSQAEAEAVGRGWRIETPASSTTFWSVWPHWAVLNHFGQLLRSPTQSQKLVFLGTSKKILRKIEKNQINQLELKTQIKQFSPLALPTTHQYWPNSIERKLTLLWRKVFFRLALDQFLIFLAIFWSNDLVTLFSIEGRRNWNQRATTNDDFDKKSKSWKRKFLFCFEK